MTTLKIINFSLDASGFLKNSQCAPNTGTNYSTFSIKDCTTIQCTTVDCTTINCTTVDCTTVDCTTIRCNQTKCSHCYYNTACNDSRDG